MTRQTGAGDLRERVIFARPIAASDGGGGVMAGFEDQFTVWAEFTHLRGGETILSARLQGQHTIAVRIRASSAARRITTDWRAQDARTLDLYNVRDVTPTPDRKWIDVLVQSGVA